MIPIFYPILYWLSCMQQTTSTFYYFDCYSLPPQISIIPIFKIRCMNFGNTPFNEEYALDIHASTEDIINALRFLDQPASSSCPKKQIDEGQKSNNSIGQKPSLSQQIQRVRFQPDPINAVIAYQVIRKRKKEYVQQDEIIDTQLQMVDSQSNKRITDYFGYNSHKNQKKLLKPENSGSPQKIEQQDDDFNSNPIVKNLKEKIVKKKKLREELKMHNETLSKRNNSIKTLNIQKIAQQRDILTRFLVEKYSEKIYYEMINRIQIKSEQFNPQAQEQYISMLNNKIKMLDQEKKKKNNKEDNEESTYLLQYYGADRQSYIKQWKKKIQAEKISMEKQQIKKNAFHDLNFRENYYELPEVFADKNGKRIIIGGKYLPLYSREDPNRLLDTGVQVRAMDLEALLEINLLVISLPKMMKNQKKIEAHSGIRKMFYKNRSLHENRKHSLLTELIYFQHIQGYNSFLFGHLAWPEKGRRICLPEMMEKYENFNEPIARYIIKIILRGLEELRNRLEVFALILPENIIFNERNQIKLDSWLKNELIKFPEFEEYFLSGQKHLYFPPQYRKKLYENNIEGISIWAAGIIFYQLLFGRKPFNYQKNTVDHQEFYIINTVQFPQRPSIAETTKDFIKKCLTIPEDRISLSKALRHPCFDPKK